MMRLVHDEQEELDPLIAAFCCRRPAPALSRRICEFLAWYFAAALLWGALVSAVSGATTQPSAPNIVRDAPVTPGSVPYQQQAGTRYLFAPGTYYWSRGVTLAADDIELRGTRDAAGNRLCKIVFASPIAYDQAFVTWGHRQAIRDFDFEVRYTGPNGGITDLAFCDAHGSDICITGCSGIGNRFVNLSGVDRVLIEANRFDSPVSYWIYSSGAVSHVFVHANVVTGHVRYGHVYRQDSGSDVIFDSNVLHNPPLIGAAWNGHVLKVCGGSNFASRNDLLDGSCQFGPNPQPGPSSLIGVTLSNDAIGNYVMLEAGLASITWSGGSLISRATGSCISIKRYDPRPIATGTIDHLAAKYAAPSLGTPTLFSGNNRGHVHVGPGVTFNGRAVSQW
jgi:hypothetical protein